MKSVPQQSKTMSNSSAQNVKTKRNSKDREKRKSQTGQSDNNSNEKGSPSKESNREYAGIDSESLRTYAEQSTFEYLSDEVCKTLTEDINFKLRFIIHEAVIKARLSSRTAISSTDIDETFKSLNIEKVYGAPSSPNWYPLDDDETLFYLDDTELDISTLIDEDNVYSQPKTVEICKKWYPDNISKNLKNYFTVTCQSVVSSDSGLRKLALKDISENNQIGPIVEWFYNFGYFLLSKDITYDYLTLYALNLIETLENSPIGSSIVSEKLLKLLVRLILQRLLKSVTTDEVLGPMCSLLATLCLRPPLRSLVITKIQQKLYEICHDFSLPILKIVYFLGLEAVESIFLPNMNYFLGKVTNQKESELTYTILGIYSILCRAEVNDSLILQAFLEEFGDVLVMFWKPQNLTRKAISKEEINFVQMKKQLIKTRRKLDCTANKLTKKKTIEEVFEIPTHSCVIRQKIDEHNLRYQAGEKETHVVIGKTSLLLPVLKCSRNKLISITCDHTLLSYNL